MLQLILAIWLGKLTFFLTRSFKKGGGSAAPGYYALKIYPGLVSDLASQIPQNIVITGTNGKTTTAKLLNQLVKDQNLTTLRNSTGSNLERGITSALISKTDLWGKIKNVNLGIWEMDEAAFNSVVFKIKPQLIVFLNAFRDQLDRYGEVDMVIDNWRKSINKIDWDPALLTNTGNINTSWIADCREKRVFGFKVKNHTVVDERTANPIKSKKILPKDDFNAKIIRNLGLKGAYLEIGYPQGRLSINFPVPGIYHVYDLLAAFGAYYLLNLPVEDLGKSLKGFKPAFGRVEEIKFDKHKGYILLIKNPAGANSVFETLAPEIKSADRLLLALNDNFADGTDVSWIWDARFEMLKGDKAEKVIAAGSRAEDLGLRLKYAGFDTGKLEYQNDLEKAFKSAADGLKGRVFILPTYTALLELQKILTAKKIKSVYWEEN